jgi:hypothetical protein
MRYESHVTTAIYMMCAISAHPEHCPQGVHAGSRHARARLRPAGAGTLSRSARNGRHARTRAENIDRGGLLPRSITRAGHLDSTSPASVARARREALIKDGAADLATLGLPSCPARVMSYTTATILSAWTPEEDERLRQAVERYKDLKP